MMNAINNIDKFYDLFVGNKNSHIIWDQKGFWKRSFLPITRTILYKHFNKETVIGSYPIYKKNEKAYSQWICIDTDSHLKGSKNEVNEEIKKRQEKFVRYLYSSSHIYLDVPKDCLLVEDSVGGFHIWIILKKETLLEDVGKYVYKIKETLNELADDFYEGEKPEFYPKQYSIDHLDKEMGNAVRLPFGRNFGKNGDCKIILGDIDNLQPIDLKPIVKDVKIEDVIKMSNISKPSIPLEKFDSKDVSLNLHFWLEFPIRPCFKRIIRGETQCHKQSNAHQIRIALVHECRYHGMPIDIIVNCFENQEDFNRAKTYTQILSVLREEDWRYNCDKIDQLGYCHTDCELKNEAV